MRRRIWGQRRAFRSPGSCENRGRWQRKKRMVACRRSGASESEFPPPFWSKRQSWENIYWFLDGVCFTGKPTCQLFNSFLDFLGRRLFACYSPRVQIGQRTRYSVWAELLRLREWEQTGDASHEFIGEWKWWEKQRISISEWITCFAFCFCISIFFFLFSFFLFSTAKDILTCKDGIGLDPQTIKNNLICNSFFFFLGQDNIICNSILSFCEIASPFFTFFGI